MFKSIFKPLARNHGTKQKTPGKTQGLGRQATEHLSGGRPYGSNLGGAWQIYTKKAAVRY